MTIQKAGEEETLKELLAQHAATRQSRMFQTGAYRDVDIEKFEYAGFLSPAVLKRYAAFMHKNRVQSDGQYRASDNWKRGIPRNVYLQSMFRHFMEVWNEFEGPDKNSSEYLEEELCAIMFNAMGMLFETLKQKTHTSGGTDARV
jgi:hypothetical protein